MLFFFKPESPQQVAPPSADLEYQSIHQPRPVPAVVRSADVDASMVHASGLNGLHHTSDEDMDIDPHWPSSSSRPSLDYIRHNLRDPHRTKPERTVSAPPPPTCQACGRVMQVPRSFHTPSPVGQRSGSPDIVPPDGPLMAAAFESGIDAVTELSLLKQQVQDVARVCTAVANGDLSQKIEVRVQGQVMIQLKNAINTMVDRLAQFALEVTRVSQEVGTDG